MSIQSVKKYTHVFMYIVCLRYWWMRFRSVSKFWELHRRHQLLLVSLWCRPLWTPLWKPYVDMQPFDHRFVSVMQFLRLWFTVLSFEGYIRCRDAPCENNATCSDVISGYICHCPRGYTDVNCSTGWYLSKCYRQNDSGTMLNKNRTFYFMVLKWSDILI